MSDETNLIEGPDLARRVRDRDPDALSEVIRAYLPQILRAARGAGLSAQEAEEVTQATFTTFLETASRFEGRSKVRTWIFGILFRKISEARRGLQRDRRSDSIDDVVESRFRADGRWAKAPRPLDEQIGDAELRKQLDDCLEGASTKQRLAFLLREAQGLSTEEICKILDVSRTNLGVLIFRARNRLRECLEDKGVTR